jgi:uncharacterized protein YjeT (DUF2065 family)
MLRLVILVGYLAMALSVVIFAAPKTARRIIDSFSLGSRLYLVGLIRLVFGIILLNSASQARLWGYVVLIGLLAAASGLCLFFFALRRTKKILSRLRNQSNLTLRVYAIIALAIWAVLIYALIPATAPFLPR